MMVSKKLMIKYKKARNVIEQNRTIKHKNDIDREDMQKKYTKN